MPPNKRREMDLMKLMMKDFKVEMEDDGLHKFFVHFHGPKEKRVLNHDEVKRLKSALGYLGRFGIGGSFGNKCIYEGGLWKVSVKLPDGYPFVSPSILFVNKMYHPNIDEVSGSICLDVIKKKWSPMFDLVNVFENFLPQLLLDPNASDPLNREAAVLMTRNRPAYEQKVKEYCKRYAKPEETAASEDDTSEVELSEDEYDSIDEQLGRRSD